MRQKYIGRVLLVALLVITGCSRSTQTARNPQTDALLRAAREGNADTVKVLLSSPGADVNATDERGSTALLEAARYGHDDIARALIASKNLASRSELIPQPLCLKYCTARSCRSASSRVSNVPRFFRLPVFGSTFR